MTAATRTVPSATSATLPLSKSASLLIMCSKSPYAPQERPFARVVHALETMHTLTTTDFAGPTSLDATRYLCYMYYNS